MNKQNILKNMNTIIIAAYFLFVIGMVFWCMQGYHAAKHALSALDSQKSRLTALNVEIANTNHSLVTLKADQEEFRKLLFNDRDVPAFLDGLSRLARGTDVHIIDMKTQHFNQIALPKEMKTANSIEQSQAYGGNSNAIKSTSKAELQNLLTLAAMPIQIHIDGSFRSIVNFLNAVENDRQLLTVSNVEIIRNRNYPQLDCNFVLKIYSLEQLKDI